MPETQSLVDIGYGSRIRIGRGAGPDWTEILGGDKMGVPSQPPEDIDVTTFHSIGRTRETKPGLKPVADYSLDLQYWPGSPHDLLMEELDLLTAEGTRETVLLEITPNGGHAFVFMCYINEYTPDMSVAEKQTVKVAFKVSARIITLAAPTNVLLPAISGTAQVGETLTALVGIWTEAPTHSYQWQEDTGGGFVDIVGETGATLVVPVGSLGLPIAVEVTGTNSIGAAVAVSAATADVIAA